VDSDAASGEYAEPVYRAVLTGMLSGAVWTAPGQAGAGQSVLEFSPDGPNVVGFDLDRAALTEVFGPDTGVCFPDSPGFFAGLLQLQPTGAATDGPDRVGTLVLSAFDRDGKPARYLVDLYDASGQSGWAPSTAAFPPEGLKHPVYREVTHWETRLADGSATDACTSGGVIEGGDGLILIELQKWEANPHFVP
jgi:hypothetical protein